MHTYIPKWTTIMNHRFKIVVDRSIELIHSKMQVASIQSITTRYLSLLWNLSCHIGFFLIQPFSSFLNGCTKKKGKMIPTAEIGLAQVEINNFLLSCNFAFRSAIRDCWVKQWSSEVTQFETRIVFLLSFKLF